MHSFKHESDFTRTLHANVCVDASIYKYTEVPFEASVQSFPAAHYSLKRVMKTNTWLTGNLFILFLYRCRSACSNSVTLFTLKHFLNFMFRFDECGPTHADTPGVNSKIANRQS